MYTKPPNKSWEEYAHWLETKLDELHDRMVERLADDKFRIAMENFQEALNEASRMETKR